LIREKQLLQSNNQEDKVVDSAVGVEVFNSFEELTPMRQGWDNFVESAGGEIFLTFDWCRVWWKYYGKDRDLRIFVFRSNNQLVGIIPLFFEKIWIGPFSVKVGKIVGSDFTISHFSIPVTSDYIKPVLKTLSSTMKRWKWDVLFIGPIAGKYKDFHSMTEVLADCFTDAYFRVVPELNVQTYFTLPDDWESYVSSLKKSERGNVRNDYNSMKKLSSKLSQNLESCLADKDNVGEYFTGFVAMHQLHWKNMGRSGHFGDWPRSVEFHRELAETHLELDRLRFLRTQIGSECFGYQYSYKFGNRHYLFLDAWPDKSAAKGVGLGRVNFCEALKKAIGEKIHLMDSMRGRYEHKLRLGGELFPMKALYIVSETWSSRVRFMMLRAFSFIMNLCYYKVWYCRIAPKLPIRRRPLWRIWMRTNGFS